MENLKLENIESPYAVIDDVKAEWVMRKMLEERAEFKRFENTCNTFIEEYKFKILKEKEKYDKKTEQWKLVLQEFFNNVITRKTKTFESYKLPSGLLKKKFGGYEYVKDDEGKFIDWLVGNGYGKFVKTKQVPNWGDFKKELEIKIVNGNVITKNGEIVEGINAVEKSDVFDIELE